MESTQERLLGTAAYLFADRGFAAVSMRDIAAAAGITQAAIYHHFTNKEELYFASVRHLLEEKVRPLTQGVEGTGTAEEKLSRLIAGMMRLAVDDPFGRIYYRELLDGDRARLLALSEDVYVVVKPEFDVLLTAIAPQVDTHLAVVSLIGMILHHAEVIKLGPLLPWGRPEHGDPAVLAEHISNLFLRGLKGL